MRDFSDLRLGTELCRKRSRAVRLRRVVIVVIATSVTAKVGVAFIYDAKF